MPRLSIVIPALGAWEQLETTLVAVLGNRPADTEVIVALHEAYEDPYGLEGEVRFVRLRPGATTLDAWNAGIAACRAPLVHLLACGAAVGEAWCDAAVDHFDDARVAAVAPLVLSEGERIGTAGWHYSLGGAANHFAAGKPTDAIGAPDERWMGPHGAAAFYRLSAFGSAPAAFDSTLGNELAPLDLALRMRQAGYRAILEPRSRVIIPELPTVMSSALQAERLFWRHAANDGSWQPVVAHVGAVALEFAGSLPRPCSVWQLAQRFGGMFAGRRSICAAFRLPPFVDSAEPESHSASSNRRFHSSHGSAIRASRRRVNVTEQTGSSRNAH